MTIKKMKIDKELIEKVAKISRLNLSEENKEDFIKDFEEVLKLFSKIKETDTRGIELSVQPVKVENVLREDKAEKSLDEKDIFLNAEHKEKRFFKGPRIL